MAATFTPSRPTMIGRLGAWWRKRRERRTTLADLAVCSDAERSRLARDAGVATGELQVLAGKWPDAADLLAPRLAMLGLDATALARNAPAVMRDLQRVCSVCSSKRVCAHDLARGAGAGDAPSYCANAGTLDALRAKGSESGGGRR